MEFIQTNRVRHVDLNKFTIEELIKLPLSPGWVLISQKKNGIGEWRKDIGNGHIVMVLVSQTIFKHGYGKSRTYTRRWYAQAIDLKTDETRELTKLPPEYSTQKEALVEANYYMMRV